MSKREKIQLYVSLTLALVFLCVAAYQWYDLHQIEQGLKEGSLSIILHKVYEMAGKWGVAAFYMPFSIYCFWRAYKVVKSSKENDYGKYEDENN